MRAIVLDGHGGPEVLQLREIPDPEPGAGDVLVDVASTAVNRADILQRLGLYPGPTYPGPEPGSTVEVPGLEFAGTVAAIGTDVTGVAEGDEVMGIVTGGGYAGRVATPARQVMPVPQSVPVADAGAIPEVWITAFDALVVQGGLTSGRTALVHAGASGVGTAAIQIAKAVGAAVVVTASGGKVERCREIGADVAVDYTAGDFGDAVSEFTAGEGVDVVLDVIGGDYLERNVDALRVGGRIIQVGVMDPVPATVPLAKLLPKRAAVIGTVLRARPIEEKIAITQRFGREIVPLFDTGRAEPVIDSRVPLADVAGAHRRMEANANIGKIVLDV